MSPTVSSPWRKISMIRNRIGSLSAFNWSAQDFD
jgi:hypothetical protein